MSEQNEMTRKIVEELLKYPREILEKRFKEATDNPDGRILAKYWDKHLNDKLRGVFFSSDKTREEHSNVFCPCGNQKMYVNAITDDDGGGFIKLTCGYCGKTLTLMDSRP